MRPQTNRPTIHFLYKSKALEKLVARSVAGIMYVCVFVFIRLSMREDLIVSLLLSSILVGEAVHQTRMEGERDGVFAQKSNFGSSRSKMH